MLAGLFQRIAAKRLEKRFHNHFEKATGSVLHRNAIAIVMMELEDPSFSQAMRQFSPEEQPVFLMAYQCFILWVLRYVLQQRVQSAELQEITVGVKKRFANFDYYTPAVFEKIWHYTEEFMPIALRGGRNTGVVYPITHIIQAATSAGYPLSQTTLGYDFGVHVLTVMKRITHTLSPDENSDA
jgi:hypothetical protein